MAIETAGLDIGVVTAGADLSGAQFKLVKVTGADFTINVTSAATDVAIGILQNKPTSGQAADVRFMGVSKALAGASYSRGVYLMSDASGRLIAATSTNLAVAIALEAAGGANEIRSVLVLPGGKQ